MISSDTTISYNDITAELKVDIERSFYNGIEYMYVRNLEIGAERKHLRQKYREYFKKIKEAVAKLETEGFFDEIIETIPTAYSAVSLYKYIEMLSNKIEDYKINDIFNEITKKLNISNKELRKLNRMALKEFINDMEKLEEKISRYILLISSKEHIKTYLNVLTAIQILKKIFRITVNEGDNKKIVRNMFFTFLIKLKIYQYLSGKITEEAFLTDVNYVYETIMIEEDNFSYLHTNIAEEALKIELHSGT